jgi:AraC family transcriptional regulator
MGTPSEAVAADDPPAPSHAAFARILHRGRVLAVRPRFEKPDFGSSGPYMSGTFGRTAAYLCVLQLRDFAGADSWCDDRYRRTPFLPTGAMHVFDLHHEWRTDARDPFDNIHLNITQEVIDELTAPLGIDRVAIDLPAGGPAPARDDTLRHLAASLLPAFERPTELSALYADHVLSAAALHLVSTFGKLKAPATRLRGGLSPWQERCAREMLLDSLTADIGLKAIADACGLSIGHFIKAFRESVGLPPHRWLLRQRVLRAREMLLKTDERLGAIALACGFADQSHMSRVFSKAYGVPPGTWRQQRKS